MKSDKRIPYFLHWSFLFPEEDKTPNISLYFNKSYVLEPLADQLKSALEFTMSEDLRIDFKRKPARVDPLGNKTDHRIGSCAIYLIYPQNESSQTAIASLRARRPIDSGITIAVKKNNRFNALVFLNSFVKDRYHLHGERMKSRPYIPPEQFYEPRMFQ